MKTLTRIEWISSVAQLLAGHYGEKEPNDNLKKYAETMAEEYFDNEAERFTPTDAVDEELSYS